MVYPNIFPMAISATASFVEAYLATRRKSTNQILQQKQYQENLLREALELYPTKTITKSNRNCSYCGRLQTSASNCEGCGAPKCA